MSRIKIGRMTNANVYVNGKSLLGRVEEANLPDIPFKFTDSKALGMIGTIETFSGVDKMEASLKWTSFYADVLTKFANPTETISIQVRGNLETHSSSGMIAQEKSVAFLRVTPKNFPGGNFKQHDNVEATSKLSASYYKLEIDGKPIIEYDAMANIYKVNGVDIFAKYRLNTGA